MLIRLFVWRMFSIVYVPIAFILLWPLILILVVFASLLDRRFVIWIKAHFAYGISASTFTQIGVCTCTCRRCLVKEEVQDFVMYREM